MNTLEKVISDLEALSPQDRKRALAHMLASLRDPPMAGDADLLIASESALAEDWLSPEEDAAWAHL